MAKIRLKYVDAFVDRQGRARYYFRRGKGARIPLPGKPGSDAFLAAYAQALRGHEGVGASKTRPGSFNALCVAYYLSSDFTTLADITKSTYRNVIDRFRDEHGDLPVVGFQARHAKGLLDARADHPGAAKNLHRILRVLMRFAVDRGWRQDNPMLNVRLPKRRVKSHGYRTMTDADIAKFRAHFPFGDRARLALELLLGTAARRSDAVGLGRQHIESGKLRFRQGKTGEEVILPIAPELAEAISHLPKDQLTFLVTKAGVPFTAPGFTNWFKECCAAAGLPPNSSPHTVRKAKARRLAEAGKTVHQIGAVTGHTTLSEVQRYTKAADRERLAEEAMGSKKKRRTPNS